MCVCVHVCVCMHRCGCMCIYTCIEALKHVCLYFVVSYNSMVFHESLAGSFINHLVVDRD